MPNGYIQTAAGKTGDAMELAAGQATLVKMTTFPLILIVAFAGLYFFMRNKRTVYADESAVAQQPQL